MPNATTKLGRNPLIWVGIGLVVVVAGVLVAAKLHFIHLPFRSGGANAPGAANSSAPSATFPGDSTGGGPAPLSADASALLNQTMQLMQQKQPDAALEKVNAAVAAAPQSPAPYVVRGSIYAQQKAWDKSEKDYETALSLDPKSREIQFNVAEIKFMQKKYDAARPGFVTLQADSDMGDLAAYKVFLCDLLAGHDDVAAKELDAFNQAGSNPSYYFGNAASSIYHQKTEDARGWLTSAANIYSPKKFRIYAASLVDIGYLPLPAPAAN